MKDIPLAPGFDNTLKLLKDPYRYISTTCQQIENPYFLTRVRGRKTLCLTGSEGSELFYNPNYTFRQGAAPEPMKTTLFGKGAIQSMDGEEHLRRKKIFMSYMTREKVESLTLMFHNELEKTAASWLHKDQVILYDEMQRILTKVACKWAGVPLQESELVKRSKDLAAMFDSATGGFSHIRSRWARLRSEKWISSLVEARRNGHPVFSSGSVAETFALLTAPDGEYINSKMSAIEILNILRPTVAISVYIIFVTHALHFNPGYNEKVLKDPYLRYYFAQEVRRLYPFFPSVIAKAKHDFTWKGHRIPKGLPIILDLYGTNHDSKEWNEPERFYPERFVTKWVNSHNLIPQGGGDFFSNHRCPGENPTIILMSTALEFLVRNMKYSVPEQDLDLDLSRLPAIPKSRFVISQVQVLSKKESLKKDVETTFSAQH